LILSGVQIEFAFAATVPCSDSGGARKVRANAKPLVRREVSCRMGILVKHKIDYVVKGKR